MSLADLPIGKYGASRNPEIQKAFELAEKLRSKDISDAEVYKQTCVYYTPQGPVFVLDRKYCEITDFFTRASKDLYKVLSQFSFINKPYEELSPDQISLLEVQSKLSLNIKDTIDTNILSTLYPNLKNTKVEIYSYDSNILGTYSRNRNKIYLNIYSTYKQSKSEAEFVAYIVDSLKHELIHAIGYEEKKSHGYASEKLMYDDNQPNVFSNVSKLKNKIINLDFKTSEDIPRILESIDILLQFNFKFSEYKVDAFTRHDAYIRNTGEIDAQIFSKEQVTFQSIRNGYSVKSIKTQDDNEYYLKDYLSKAEYSKFINNLVNYKLEKGEEQFNKLATSLSLNDVDYANVLSRVHSEISKQSMSNTKKITP